MMPINCRHCRFSQKPEGTDRLTGAAYWCTYWNALVGRLVAEKGCDRFMEIKEASE